MRDLDLQPGRDVGNACCDPLGTSAVAAWLGFRARLCTPKTSRSQCDGQCGDLILSFPGRGHTARLEKPFFLFIPSVHLVCFFPSLLFRVKMASPASKVIWASKETA